jgi:hypothetical protein
MPARQGRSHAPLLCAGYERFEVVQTSFETPAIHALNHERIGELA